MEAAFSGARELHGIEQQGMLEQFAIPDHQIDAGNVHVHDASGADVEMSDFAVAHLAFGQSDERSAGMNEGVGILAQKAVVGGLARKGNGVGFGFGPVTTAVADAAHVRSRTGPTSALSCY